MTLSKDGEPRGIDRNLTSYGDPAFSKFIRRAFLASAGYDAADLDRPIVGIADTSSDYTPCHRQMPELVAAVKRGVLEAGGLPLAFPTASLGEILLSPTSMLYRNLLAMETEEMLRAQPMDAAVLLGGCDKTLPAQLMAAASADIPALCVVVGPMRAGSFGGERVGACTDCRKYWSRHRAGEIDAGEISKVRDALCPTAGTCMVMGTASTMACVAEALGMILPGGAAAPSGSGDRLRHAAASGRRAVELARERLRPSAILTRAAFLNSIAALMALGGSTNAVIHLLAIARRARVPLSLDDFDAVSRRVPLLVDCKPSGSGFLEDFHAAGGMPALQKALAPLLDGAALTAGGRKVADLLAVPDSPGRFSAERQTAIRSIERPLGPTGSLAILRGSLAPDGAVLKRSAATAALLKHRGPAAVFESPEDAERRIDDPALGLTPNHVLVLRNAGPIGAGMPEAASLPIPRRLLEAGVRDMVRVSDARMSGTAFGTVVLHASPEAAAGGPLALVRDGDTIELDADARRIDLLVDAAELARRRVTFRPPPVPERGWLRLHAERVLQAHLGADLDFLA